MFFSYLWNELRRRKKQTAVVAVGLALGIGLVITVTAMASGVRDAQATVLHSLYGVGTDVTVTLPEARGGGPDSGFRFGGNGQDTFQRDRILQTPGLATFPYKQVTAMSGLTGVGRSAGALNMTAIHIEGKLPTFGQGGGSGGGFTIGGVGGGPSTASPTPGQFHINAFSIAGVDTSHLDVGPVSSTSITSGRSLTPADASRNVAVIDKSYAKQQSLAVGGTLNISGTKFSIVGLSSASTSGSSSDVYIPLAAAQTLDGQAGQINAAYVKATSASNVGSVKKEIKQQYPKSTVTAASDLAQQVSGSLSSASNLSTKLGVWLSVAVLIAAIVIASLLTMSAVGRRVRELGTLKALGWRTPRVVAQVMGESLVQCLVGGALGIGVGLVGIWIVTRVAPTLTATVSRFGTNAGFGGGPGGGRPGGFGGPGAVAGPGGNPFVRTISVALKAPMNVKLVALALGLAILGGLVAGLLGGWRASRLRPVDAMRQVV
jgi:ABC-type antimicrobial peptide transport system permease subunit